MAVRCGFEEGWIIREQGNSNVQGGDVSAWDVRRNSGTALDNVRFSISLISDNACTDLSNWNRGHTLSAVSRMTRCTSDTICAPSLILHAVILLCTPSFTTVPNDTESAKSEGANG